MAGWGELLGQLAGNVGGLLIDSARKPGGIKRNFLPTVANYVPAIADMAGQALGNYGGKAWDNWMNPQGFMPQGPYPGGTGYNPYERPLPPNPYPYGQVPPNPLPRQDGTYLPNTNIPIQEVNPWAVTPGPKGYTENDWNRLNFPPTRYGLPPPDYSSEPFPTGRGEWFGPKPQPDPTYGWAGDWFKPKPQQDLLDFNNYPVPKPQPQQDLLDFNNYPVPKPKPYREPNPNLADRWLVPQPYQSPVHLPEKRDPFDFLQPLNIPGGEKSYETPYIPTSGKINYRETPGQYRPKRK